MASPAPATEALTAEINPAPTMESTPNTMPSESDSTSRAPSKPVHALVLDTGPLIKNEISISTLLAQAEELYTIPSVVSEIRDEATRSRFQTTLVPFLKLRTPRPASVQFVTGFARRTGDLEVLSKPDIQLLALTYELECERNGGDWRLRKEPAQKGLNCKPPGKDEAVASTEPTEDVATSEPLPEVSQGANQSNPEPQSDRLEEKVEKLSLVHSAVSAVVDPIREPSAAMVGTPADVAEQPADPAQEPAEVKERAEEGEERVDEPEEASSEEDDGDGEWITPSNIKKRQARENKVANPEPIQHILQAALITTDNAMRNVALRINLNLLDPSCQKITYLKTWVLRCHGCFKICKNLSRQFCPNCGQATLTRVSCSTDAAGNFKIYLKKNYQWNNRGNVYSIPKPTHGSASGKLGNVKGGGKNKWGNDLILAEDQKEYTRKMEDNQRTKYRDLMDDDYLPGILTGERKGGPGKIRVGAGRNVNSRKR